MRTKLIPALVVALLGIFPVVSAVAAPPEAPVSFDGAGFGHGVGASQYGAYGRALDGQTYQQILVGPNGYYQGATLKTMGADIVDPGTVFTNVASDISSTVFSVKQRPGYPTSGVQFVREAQGGSPQTVLLLGNNDTVSVTDTTPGSNQPAGCSVSMIVSGIATDLGVGGCDVTLSLVGGTTDPNYLISAINCRRANDCTFGYGVALRSVDNASSQRTVYDTVGGCIGCPIWQGFDLVVEATLNDYTLGIKEVPYAWPSEALKVQAIAARSYAASFVAGVDHRSRGCFCDVKNDSSSQVYVGWTQNRIYWQNWDAATRQTNSIVVSHPQAPDEGIVRAYYSSSNGGASEASGEKWTAQHPYLVSVPDPWSLTAPDNQYASWSVPTTAGDIVMRAWGPTSSYELIKAEVIARNTSGSAKTIRFTATDLSGTVHTRDFPVATVFGWYGLKSWYFDIDDSSLDSVPPKGPPVEATSVGLQDPRTGIWTLRDVDGTTESFYYGDPSDVPFVGDWDGDGDDTLGLYRRSAGFLFLRNSNTQGVADIDIFYGIPGDIPVAGDWDGDGDDTIGIYRPSEARFYLRNSNTQGIADISFGLGVPGDQPTAGDWNGDGVDTVGVYRPSTKTVYLANSVGSGNVSVVFVYSGTVPGDRMIAGDWDNDGDDTLGIFRPSTGKFYLRDTFTQSSANVVFTLGSSWMNPVAGNWNG